jgi:hypothetical protein
MAKDEHKEEARESRAIIDRIEEGDVAVLMAGEDGKTQVIVPVSLLPEGAKDGDHLRIHISLDRPSRSSAEERIKKLQDELKERSGTTDKKDFKL